MKRTPWTIPAKQTEVLSRSVRKVIAVVVDVLTMMLMFEMTRLPGYSNVIETTK